MTVMEETNEEKIEKELDRRIANYRRKSSNDPDCQRMNVHGANVLEHFRNSVVRPMTAEIRKWRRAEQEIVQG